ncbi:fumarylacetoacetate hydrolase family protein [Oceanobacter mangrovi]|uniref:fumarylacetoacetate hydrolase family protein n=1 Tax=Oceanobacter mangrovi TaxID=2862510 RepID=UPI001C8D6AB3|nr:fumarylacetoacetate hydrolase family protein [Oceanobacter mangrovi]
MKSVCSQPVWGLGMYSIAGSTPFAGLMVKGEVMALQALAACTGQQQTLFGTDTLMDCLQYWPHNQPLIKRLAEQVLELGWQSLQIPQRPVAEDLLTLHAPLPQPRQFFCSGANYRQHVKDLVIDQRRDPEWQHLNDEEILRQAEQFVEQRAAGTPYVFSKVSSSICGPNDPVMVADYALMPDWELELAVVIGKPGYQLSDANALEVVAGYTIVNDITNRELTHRPDLHAIGSDWLMGKCQPGYSPMGPYLIPASEVADPQQLRIQLQLNNELMQDESSADMIFDVRQLLVYLSSRVQLYPGDILITGSPAGNGSHFNRFLKPGDVMTSCIEGLGCQQNRVV